MNLWTMFEKHANNKLDLIYFILHFFVNFLLKWRWLIVSQILQFEYLMRVNLLAFCHRLIT